MSMFSKITYKPTPKPDETAVYVDRRRVGTIHELSAGYCYAPKGKKKGSVQMYQSMAALKRFLESD